MADEPKYKDAIRPTVFQDGLEFQDFVCIQLYKEHIILQNLSSKKYQYELGESLQGFEIKLDQRCTDSKRISIEVAEKSNKDMENWVDSGILRKDNTWLYIQGNEKIIFIFGKKLLQQLFNSRYKETVIEKHGTVKTFYLDFKTAHKYAIKTICLDDKLLPFLE